MSIGQHQAVGDVATARILFGYKGAPSPQRSGWKYWTGDPQMNFQGFGMTSGFVCVSLIEIDQDDVITNVEYDVFTAGSGLTSGQCFAGLYQGGVLKGISATQHTAMQSTGRKTAALVSGPIAVTKGFAYSALLSNGGTRPVWGFPIGALNGNAALVTRFDGLITGGYETAGSRTTLPSTLGALTSAGYPWAALS